MPRGEILHSMSFIIISNSMLLCLSNSLNLLLPSIAMRTPLLIYRPYPHLRLSFFLYFFIFLSPPLIQTLFIFLSLTVYLPSLISQFVFLSLNYYQFLCCNLSHAFYHSTLDCLFNFTAWLMLTHIQHG